MSSQGEPFESDSDDQDGTMTQEDLASKWRQAEETIQRMKGDWGSQKDALSRENAMLREELAKLNGRVEEQGKMFSSKQEPAPVDPFNLDEDAEDEFRNNPAALIPFFRERMQEQQEKYVDAVVALLGEREKAIASRMSEIDYTLGSVKRVVDPDISPWVEEIDNLRSSNAAFKNLDDNTVIEVLKTMGKKPMEYRGSPGGRRSASGGGRSDSKASMRPFDESSIQGQFILKMTDGNVQAAKKVWERSEKRRIGA